MRKSFGFLLAVVLVLFSSIACAEDREFFELCAVGTPQDVQRAIEEGVDVNARDKSGATLLMWAAAYNGNPEVLKVLLEAGAEVDARSSEGMTPLMYAAMLNQNPEIIRVLLEAGADVNARDNDGWTPLMWAAMLNENPEVVRVLLEAGADATLTNSLGKKAIDYARENPALKDTEVFWELCKRSF